MGRAIGIDLGTTNSCAAVIEDNQPKIIMYRGGSYTIPSLFAIDEGGRMLVGHDAKKQAALNPENTVYAPKRLLGRSFHSSQVEKIRQVFTYNMVEGNEGEVLINVGGDTFDLREISAQILRKIKEVAEEYLGDTVTNAVITVPAYFNDKQRQAVRQAGKLADLHVLRILNEPTAAALAYGLGKNLQQRLAVYDLGGGTFDVSIIEIRDKVFEVVATGGDTFLGGIDFDDRVIGRVLERFMDQTGVDLSTDRVALQRLREAAERAKITLSTTKDTRIEVPFIARGKKGILNIDEQFTRDELEELVGDLVGRTVTTCERIFDEAKMSPSDIDEVLLVGGQSRMPLVQRSVKGYFGKDPCKGVHPDEAVAVGAAIMAHSLTHAAEKVTLLDVLPMPIGIAKVDHSFLPLFPKNCPIPHVRRLTLTNSKDRQRTIMLKIYQGDSKVAAENELLGTFVFSGIRAAPRGKVKVDVWLNIDSEGILSLSAKDKQTGDPIDVHLKLKNKTLAPTLSLETEAKGGEMMSAEAEAKKKAAAEAKAHARAKNAGEVDATAASTRSEAKAPEPEEKAAEPEKKAEEPEEKAEDEPGAKPAKKGKRKGKGIVVSVPKKEAADAESTATAAADEAKADEPEADKKADEPEAAAKDETDSAKDETAELPVPSETGEVTAAEQKGCLSMLNPLNWFR